MTTPPTAAFGLDAFVARVSLIELAEQTLDLPYYIFHPDTTGSILIDRLTGRPACTIHA